MSVYQHRSTMLHTPAKQLPGQQPIDRLYQEFQSLKNRIRSCSNKRKNHPSNKKEANRDSYLYEPFDMNLQKKEKCSLRREMKSKVNELELTSSIFIDKDNRLHKQFKKEEQDQSFDLNKLQQMVSNINLPEFESKCNRQITHFQSKLSIIQEMLRGVATLVKMKKTMKMTEIRSRKRSWFSHSPQKERPIAQIINQYETKIELLTKKYQNKLKEVERASSKRSSSQSTTKNSYQIQTNEFQSLLLARQSQVSLLKIQNSKLRRANDKLQLSYASQLKLISSLQERIIKIEGKDLQFNNQMQSGVYEKKIRGLTNRIKELEEMLENKDKENQLKKSIIKGMDNIIEQADSEQPEKNGLLGSLSRIDSQPQICKSMILESRRRKKYENMKKLQIQIDLITQQNRNLQIKKHFLQSQNRQIELDEQRFEQQSNILKKQIRYLNANLKILDEAAVSLLKRQTLKRDKIEELGNEFKCKKMLMGHCEAVSCKTIK